MVNITNFANKLLLELRYMVYRKRQRDILNKNMKDYEYYEGSKEEYEKVVLPFWEKYGMKPDIRWFQFFGYKDQKFNPHFIPDDFFYTDLYKFLNDVNFDEKLQNKIFLDSMLHDVNRPRAVLKYENKLFVSENNEFLTKEEALQTLKKEGKVIVKPSDDMQGNGVEILNFTDNEKKAKKLFEEKVKLGDFIVQELVKQSDQMNRLNKSSVNTFRITTLLINDKVEFVSSIVRYGQEGSIVDNMARGGISRVLDKDGYMSKQAKIHEKLFTTEDFKSEKLEGFKEALALAKKLHPRFSHARYIGWDFAVDQNNQPVFIELNAYPVNNQRQYGPALGDFTAQILDEYLEYKKSKK
ncbi:sugar-transfer associated ATP-grasp domain-containing protein [Helcococcus ovis]|uniref:ATP-grasp domain-containing protein n=1 Tax=Helcococcus ovis TaxID=72026 RepID=A0A4R9C530_9FIRM|nr:sugar-transfer associated ATP-grasp domain-containing protein [Helcococcus ovis]TFF66189.1 hypothetical protein EQF92_00415 [Helcococcus ovis]TFF67332.1 hypothetical protein EQF91_01535 [Helcococcus ovis]TFF67609.1 hypothetical protein EQF93_05060 [Helcococcus ovis]WNZ00971.1 sugar-transfer associated ATP-grasp domain-containing protein [Helcococcus ovis]